MSNNIHCGVIHRVAMWLLAIGLGSKAENFKEQGVDGSMLVLLSQEDFADLGLSSLQGKKILNSLEFSKNLAEGNGQGSSTADQEELQQLRDENSALRMQLAEYQKREAPPEEKAAREPKPEPVVAAAAPSPQPARAPPSPEKQKKSSAG